MRRTVCSIVCAMAAVTGTPWAANPDIAGERPAVRQKVTLNALRMPEVVDRDAAKRERDGLYAWLVAEQVGEGVARPLDVQLTGDELAALGERACEGCSGAPSRLRVGLVVRVSAAVGPGAASWGAARAADDGGMVWSAAVRSEGASGLRLRFTDFHLPPGSELYLFSDRGEVAGPYVLDGPGGSGDFWSHLILGEVVYLQLRRYGPSQPSAGAPAPMLLEAVGHVGSDVATRLAGAKSFCDFNAPCIVNAECAGDPPPVATARDAVAHMLFVDGPYLYACSGGLLNNTAGDGTPYFLTANHCLSSDEVAATLETYFKWAVPCGTTCPEQWGRPVDAVSVLGAEVVATNQVGDYSLLRLDGDTAPAGTALLGWTSQPVAFDEGRPLYRISHPAGAPQAYSEHRVDVDASTCLFWPRGSRIYSRDVVGATEGGSSGSPVVDEAGRVVGQLSGACGLFARLPCLSAWHATVDGAFASYFSEVAAWLAPPGGCEDDTDGDGFIALDCGGDDCDDRDFLVNPAAAEVCDNGLDDDCDGSVDGADPDCGLCLDTGAPCAKAADCCSGWCRWFQRTCR